ncbi:hypothetical protein BJY00DRAFT_325664 [Aspergillus carlsbadensis]|nr:hypothetical protein BJY00DRAFT_325664 [Aspergillus carlsbadensis]
MRVQDILSAVGSASLLGSPDQQARSLFTFGDSYTTTGFNASSTQPSLSNPMGNPPLGQGTASDSTNWVGYLATIYNETPVLSYNFAVFDATVDNAVARGVPEDFVRQVSTDFEPYYCRPSHEDPSVSEGSVSALFMIWFGINDALHIYSDPDPTTKTSLVLQSYFNQLTKLHACGGRSFVLINVPPTHRTPKFLAYRSWERRLYEASIRDFNFQLHAAALRWVGENSDSRIAIYDAWEFASHILDHPGEYGFVDSSCIGEGCVWWDDFHPRSAFHQLLAADIAVFLRTAFAQM